MYIDTLLRTGITGVTYLVGALLTPTSLRPPTFINPFYGISALYRSWPTAYYPAHIPLHQGDMSFINVYYTYSLAPKAPIDVKVLFTQFD
jgi:hypothetical protein